MEEIIKRMNEKSFLKVLKNYRDIDIKEDSLIVLGWEENESAYSIMGIYKGGNMYDSVELKNTIVLRNISRGFDITDYIKEESAQIETADWWRTPTDDEVKFYHHNYKKTDVINHINKLIKEIKLEMLTDNEIMEYLNDIKDSIDKEWV